MFGGGKTTRLEAMGWISYRGMVLGEANTEADLKKMFDLWRGTAIIDEADLSRSDLYSTIIKILITFFYKSTETSKILNVLLKHR